MSRHSNTTRSTKSKPGQSNRSFAGKVINPNEPQRQVMSSERAPPRRAKILGDNVTAQRSDKLTEGWGAPRSRVVTWHDPGPSTARGMAMAGLDYLQAMIDGTLPPPPMVQLMRFDIVSAEPGRVVFTCEPDESAYNPIGAVHGGFVCTLLDSVTACAAQSMLPQGRGLTSVEIKVNYLKAVRLGSGLLTATGTVVKAGSRIAFTEGAVADASGAVVATASSTLAVFDT
jgi:uncharacterized protein (TIGR00369 family)